MFQNLPRVKAFHETHLRTVVIPMVHRRSSSSPIILKSPRSDPRPSLFKKKKIKSSPIQNFFIFQKLLHPFPYDHNSSNPLPYNINQHPQPLLPSISRFTIIINYPTTKSQSQCSEITKVSEGEIWNLSSSNRHNIYAIVILTLRYGFRYLCTILLEFGWPT